MTNGYGIKFDVHGTAYRTLEVLTPADVASYGVCRRRHALRAKLSIGLDNMHFEDCCITCDVLSFLGVDLAALGEYPTIERVTSRLIDRGTPADMIAAMSNLRPFIRLYPHESDARATGAPAK